MYFPWGWKATVDGQETPIGRVDYLLRAMNIPEGEHTVVMSFDPPSLHTTAAIARISIILIFIWAVLALFYSLLSCQYKSGEDND